MNPGARYPSGRFEPAQESGKATGSRPAQADVDAKLINAGADVVDEMLEGHPRRAWRQALASRQFAPCGNCASRTARRQGRAHAPRAAPGMSRRFWASSARDWPTQRRSAMSSPRRRLRAQSSRLQQHVGGAGVLFMYGNYSGDVMNFDMASEVLAMEGVEARTVLTTDDIASAPRAVRAKRRGVAGNVFISSEPPGPPPTACCRSTKLSGSRTPGQRADPTPLASRFRPVRCRRPADQISGIAARGNGDRHGHSWRAGRAPQGRLSGRYRCRRDPGRHPRGGWYPLRGRSGRGTGQLAGLHAADGASISCPPCRSSDLADAGLDDPARLRKLDPIVPRSKWRGASITLMHLDDGTANADRPSVRLRDVPRRPRNEPRADG